MVAPAVLAELQRLGIQVLVRGDQLITRSPPGAITPGLAERIIAHRADLIRYLSEIRRADGLLDIERGRQRPGVCGSCVFWQAIDEAYMGTCSLDSAAFAPEPKPLAIHELHRCCAHGGRGYQASPDETQRGVKQPATRTSP